VFKLIKENFVVYSSHSEILNHWTVISGKVGLQSDRIDTKNKITSLQ